MCVGGGAAALSIWGYYVSIKPKIKNFKKNQSQEYEILNGPKKHIKWNIKIKIFFKAEYGGVSLEFRHLGGRDVELL